MQDRCLKIEHARFYGRINLPGFNTGAIFSRRTGDLTPASTDSHSESTGYPLQVLIIGRWIRRVTPTTPVQASRHPPWWVATMRCRRSRSLSGDSLWVGRQEALY